jgi:hypothetical protein
MIGAGIYGFVDYKKTTHNKEFTKMYDSKEEIELAKDDKSVNDITKKTETEIKEKSIAKKQTERKDEFTENELVTEDPVVTTEATIPEKTTLSTSLKEMIANPDKPVKKLNYKLFSRAPLERKYLEKNFKLEELKSGKPGKITQKDSLQEN